MLAGSPAVQNDCLLETKFGPIGASDEIGRHRFRLRHG